MSTNLMVINIYLVNMYTNAHIIFRVQQIIEKRKKHNLLLFLLFIDYEKAYDNVNRDKLWK